MEIRLSGIIEDSIVDGPGLRCVIFTQGCIHDCPGCHNKHTHAIYDGYSSEISDIVSIIRNNPLTQGVTISGGEPFMQPGPLFNLLKEIKQIDKNIIVYTGYTLEDLLMSKVLYRCLTFIDYLIDGPFIQSQKSMDLKYRGSKNQRIIDVKASLTYNEVIIAEL